MSEEQRRARSRVLALCTCVKHATQARGWHNNESTKASPLPARTSGLRLLVLIRVAITSLIQLAIYRPTHDCSATVTPATAAAAAVQGDDVNDDNRLYAEPRTCTRPPSHLMRAL